MKNLNSDINEQIILESSSISIKGIKYRVLLTNYRIALYDAPTKKQNDIALSDVQKVKAESSLNGDPTLILFILSQSGENKKMIFNFFPDGENERNQWITEISKLIKFHDNEHPDTFFCSKCGNQVIDGSLFCNRCGSKIIQPEMVSSSSNEIEQSNHKTTQSKMSTEKITLPSRNVQYTDTNTPYIRPKESKNLHSNNEPILKKLSLSLPTIPTQIKNIPALCCGGLILLIIISAIFSSIMHGSTSSATNTDLSTKSTSSVVSSTTTAKTSDPKDALSTYLFAYQHVGSTFPVKITASSLYNYLSKNATSTTTKDDVGIVVSAIKTRWDIYDYTIGNTQKMGNRAVVTVDITWQSREGIQISRTEQIPLVFEDNEWKLDKFFYSP